MREAWDSFQVEDVGRKAKFKSGCPKQNQTVKPKSRVDSSLLQKKLE